MDSDSDGSVDNEHSESSDDEEVEEDSDVSGDSYEEDYTPQGFIRDLRRIRNNDPKVIRLEGVGRHNFIQNFTNESWEEIGRDISNNTQLEKIYLVDGALNDEKISFLFRGLTRSSSIETLLLRHNELSLAAVKSMVPFLQNATNLRVLDLNCNTIQSEGFKFLLRALHDSPITKLSCFECGIESIEINTYFPRKLKQLDLSDNSINSDGCREIAKLLQGGNSFLESLDLSRNKILDEGVAILVDVLRNNTSLEVLRLGDNGITKRGGVMLLKLVNDISSVTATLQSNHTLREIDAESVHEKYSVDPDLEEVEEVQVHINVATNINEEYLAVAAGREKMILTQLDSANRAALAELQGVSQSLYSEINPLHLPEVLSLVGRQHGQGKLFDALKSSIAGVISTMNKIQYFKQQLAHHEAKSAEMRALLAAAMESAEQDITKEAGVISTVNRRECIRQQMAYHTAQLEELRDELAEIDAAEGNVAYSNKRRRKQ